MMRDIKLLLHSINRYFFYMKSQHWTREQMEKYQDQKLIEIVRHAGTNVPYYRKLFNEIGLDVRLFNGREDIEKIPLLDKEILRKRSMEFVVENADKYYPEWSKTSGSTGTPLNILIDIGSRANKGAASGRALYWAGYRLGKRMLFLKGFSESKKKDYGFDAKRNCLYFNSSRMTKDNCIAFSKLIKRLKPTFFEGYARSFIDLFSILAANGIKIPNPVGILCSGETITDDVRCFIEKSYNTKLFDFYGNAENSALICEMPDRKRYLMDDFFYPEVISQDGIKSKDGYGELVGTGFYNYAMPLIRYRTRDKVKVSSNNSSNPFSSVEKIEGRLDDYILLPDGRRIYFAEGALGYAKGIITAQYVQDSPDHLTINLVIDDQFHNSFYPEIEKGLKKRIGDSIKFDFQIVSELEKKKSGKSPFIINKIENISE